jgi:HAE1 family hydrophobic/amphiphilic exporter-1
MFTLYSSREPAMKKRFPRGFGLPRPAAPVFAFVMISVLCAYILRQEELGESREGRYRVYSVRFEYFGMDETEIERLITIPLEEKISGLGDIYEIRSVSEYGKSVSSVYFDRKTDEKRLYLVLRDAVDTLYSTLPAAVQKPRIFSAESGQRSFLSAAVFTPGDLNRARLYAEDRLKRELENLEGIAEVIVSGGIQREILVEFDPEKTAAMGIHPAALGRVVQDANILSPGGTIRGKEQTRTVNFRTRLGDPAAGPPERAGVSANDSSGSPAGYPEDTFLEELKKLPVKTGEKLSSLGYFARIGSSPRERREIIRINGEECVGIDIVAASSADIVALSRKCRKILESPEGTRIEARGAGPPPAVTILRDTGRLLESAIRDVQRAIFQSVLAVLLIIPLFFSRPKTLALILLFIGADILWSLAVLHIISVKPDENLLSGISISLGLIVDPCLVMASLSEREGCLPRYQAAIPGLLSEIAASTLTTFLVILPLYFLDSIVPGIRKVALAIMVMLCNSLVLSVFFFAGFLFQGEEGRSLLPQKFFHRTRRFYTRLSWRGCLFSLARRRTMAGIYAGFAALSFILFFVSGKNISLDIRDQVLYASVEFESEKSGESVDRDLADLSDLIRREEGLRYVRLESRKGTGELEIGFDEKKTSRTILAAALTALAPQVGTGFLYVPDAEGDKAKDGLSSGRGAVREIEVATIGDEAGICREMAKRGAGIMPAVPGYIQAVLNFKEAEPAVELAPYRENLARSGLTVRDMAMDLRWTVFGPVIDKWVQDGRETDIRLVGIGTRNGSLSRLADLPVPSPAGALRLETLGNLRERPGTGKIYRRDGRRAAYFTVHLKAPSSSHAARLVRTALAESAGADSEDGNGAGGKEPIQKGYGYILSRDLELLEAQYRTLFFAFLGSGAGIFLVLLCLTEKWRNALRIASIIPVSCAVPLLVKFLSGKPLEMGDMAALVIISGLSVNNAIYIEGARLRAVHFRIREKIQSILTTSLTGIAGAAPLAFMGGEGFPTALARGILWGTAGSLAAALILFPALYRRDTH